MKPWLQDVTPALAGALLAEQGGFAVAPCHLTRRDRDNKKIITKGSLPLGWESARGATADEIRMAFANGANAYLIACGPSGIVVADLDVKSGVDGRSAWSGKPPGGLVVATPSGGLHHYYRNDAQIGCPASGLPGVDIKGIGGGVFGPGSLDGAYRVLASGPLPPWSRVGLVLPQAGPKPVRHGFFDGPDTISAASADRSIATELAKVTAHAQAGAANPGAWTGFRDTLELHAAYTLGGYVGSGYLDHEQAAELLRGAIITGCGQLWEDSAASIERGLADGSARPLAVRPPLGPVRAADAMTAGADSAHLPDDFWGSSAVLGTLRQAALCELLSPDTVLHAGYALLAAYAHHETRVDTGLRTPVSCNYLALLCSAPSGGKTESYKLARRLLPAPFFSELSGIKIAYPIGSGEGLIECYMDTVDVLDPATGKFVKAKQQVRNNALFYVDEGGQLNALMRRVDGTVDAVLRSLWGGEDAGMKNASAERTRLLPAGSYSFGLAIGYQPNTVADLLAMVGTGMPQRFAWADALVPTLPSYDVAPAPALAWQSQVLATPHQMRLPAVAMDEIRSEAKAVARGELVRGELDGHKPLMLAKMAGLLALLHGRGEILIEDWQRAQIQWAVSCAVRDHAAQRLSELRARAEEANSARYVAREIAKAAAIEAMPDGVLRVARRWARYVAEHGCDLRPGGDVSRWLGRDRAFQDVALDHAKNSQWIIDAGSDGLRPGPRVLEVTQ